MNQPLKKQDGRTISGSVPNRLSLIANVLILFVFCLISLGLYRASLYAPFILDDVTKIIDNPNIKSPQNILSGLLHRYDQKTIVMTNKNDPSRPLVYMSYALNYKLGGLNPFGYRLTNVLLHGINAFLIFLLFNKILNGVFQTSGHLLGLIGGVLFVVHPAASNVTTYVFSRSDALVTPLFLISILSFDPNSPKRWKIGASLLSFAASLGAKQIAITLPAVLLIYDYFIISKMDFTKTFENRKYHLLYWIVAALFVGGRFIIFGGIGDLEAIGTYDRFTYFVNEPFIILKYLYLLTVAKGFSFLHPMAPSYSLNEPRIWVSFVALGTILLSIFVYAYKTRSKISILLTFSMLWFIIILSPTSSFFPTTALMVENRMYLAGAGIVLAMLVSIFGLARMDPVMKLDSSFRVIFFFGILICYAVYLSAETLRRSKIAGDPVDLWSEVVSMYPKSGFAHNSLGYSYYIKGEREKAMQNFQKSIALDPHFEGANYNIANIYFDYNELDQAEIYYEKELDNNPDAAEAMTNLGLIKFKKGHLRQAEALYRRSIELNPNNFEAYGNLGNISKQQGDLEGAEEYYLKALNLSPDAVPVYINLGRLYGSRKQVEQAIGVLQNARARGISHQMIDEDLNYFLKLKNK